MRLAIDLNSETTKRIYSCVRSHRNGALRTDLNLQVMLSLLCLRHGQVMPILNSDSELIARCVHHRIVQVISLRVDNLIVRRWLERLLTCKDV